MASGAIALLLAACGDEVTEVTQVVGMQVVEEGESMPKCNTENEGQMVYSVDSAAAYYCINRKWTSLKGQDGADGKDGEDGANGKDGKNGKDGNDGSDGASCTAVAIDNGYKIVCGEDSVGVLLNGKKGEDGSNGKSFVDGWMVDPRNKQLYRVVTIGEQTWMAENLNYKTENSWCGGGSDVDEGDCSKYGRLYTWAAAIDSAKLYKDKSIDCGYGKTCILPDTVYGVCPPGWHLPDTTEWNKLFTAVGGISFAGKILKSQTGWYVFGGISYNGTDAYGFSAFPAGYRNDNGYFDNEGFHAHFWSVTKKNGDEVYGLGLNYDDERAYLDYYDKNDAFSIRCLKD